MSGGQFQLEEESHFEEVQFAPGQVQQVIQVLLQDGFGLTRQTVFRESSGTGGGVHVEQQTGRMQIAELGDITVQSVRQGGRGRDDLEGD